LRVIAIDREMTGRAPWGRVGEEIVVTAAVVAGGPGSLQPGDRISAVDDDTALLDRWRSGDARAGHDLFTRHFDDIYRFFEHKVAGDADELVQRTFTACVASRERFRGEASFRTYLFAIARNQLYSYLRALPKGEHVDFEQTSIAALVTSIPSKLGRLREVEQLRAALSTLPAEQQLLLELHYWHDLDAAALGEVFGIPAGTVRVRLLRARKALRAQMGRGQPAGVVRIRVMSAGRKFFRVLPYMAVTLARVSRLSGSGVCQS
jgi:RNA polymerase sigma factor (sigma-70 family)